MRSSYLAAGFAFGLLLLSPFCAAEGELEKEFRSVQRSIQTQLKSKNGPARLEAVKKLEGYPILEAAKVLFLHGLSSGDPAVRQGSYAALLKLKNEPAIGLYLAEAVARDLKRGAVDQASCGATCVLLASEDPQLQEKSQLLLDHAAQQPGGLVLLVALADELGAAADAANLPALRKLVDLPLFAQNFVFRRAVTHALIRIRRPEAVSALLEILESARGEVKGDIIRHLTAISGQKLGPHHKDWADWWKANQATFKFPEGGQPAVQLAQIDLAPHGGGTYYGMPLLAERIVFVMDTSGSMAGARITAAKRELISAIAKLPETTHFSVLVFNSRLGVWQEQLMPATSENKEAACTFVAAQTVQSQTASYDALEGALTFDAEAIYFLTDGAPTVGKISRPASIVPVVTKLNRSRRMTINSIGIGVGARGGAFDVFLGALAAENYGEYIRVDQ